MDGTTYTASWDHIVAIYEHDKKNEEYGLRALFKLNHNHIHIERSKMKVSNAAQVFSHKVASVIKLVADNAPKESLLANPVGTAKLCLFMYQTFDSVNASSINAEYGKPLRSAVRNTSLHMAHWKYAIKEFESMKFINKRTGKLTVPPSVKNWIFTLKSFIHLWLQLKKCNIKYFLPRQVNQDPLECLFGSVRSHGVRNINPNCYQFMCWFKTLLINNFMSLKVSGNCVIDNSESALYNLKNFIESGSSSLLIIENDKDVNLINITMIDLPTTVKYTYLTDMTIGYISGYLARSVLKDTHFCRLCKNELISDVENNDLIQIRDFTKKSLLYPSDKFKNVINQMFYITKNILPNFGQANIGRNVYKSDNLKELALIYCLKYKRRN
ncbi:unnamed protein product [Macrosiphum euphorbiae]|uniref:Transposable element P transposase n=1 Tax=Macrosiphum euphorbiae TaxID=13131 RepID=A0AAV0WCD6_9HEMI|nr:unnamed protein product [Macrosiphum euphorbiae]